MKVLAALAALLAFAGAAPAAASGDPRAALVRRYVDGLRAQRYTEAFALLTDAERAYFRNAANFASVFTADAWTIVSYRLADARDGVVFVHEDVRFRDLARDADASAQIVAGYRVVGPPERLRIDDPGKPWRAVAAANEARVSGLRVRVRKLAFFARRIEVVVTIANIGEVPITTIPYGRSVLRDADGNVYRLIETRDWRLTDRALFLAPRLVPNAQLTGQLSFEAPPLDDRARRFALTLAPNVRDGGAAPFPVEIDGIAAGAGR